MQPNTVITAINNTQVHSYAEFVNALSRVQVNTTIPVVARIKGVNEAQAKEILRSIGTSAAETIEEAAELAVKVRAGGT